jgi:UDP-glucose 4-epimerase
VVEAFMCAADAPLETTGTFVIGTGHQTAVSDVSRLMSAVMDGALLSDLSAGHPSADLYGSDCNRAAQELGWKPDFDMTEGIRRMLLWLRRTLDPEPSMLIGA